MKKPLKGRMFLVILAAFIDATSATLKRTPRKLAQQQMRSDDVYSTYDEGTVGYY